jgi:CDP-4-dehydro-6-deoxyglucose reductase
VKARLVESHELSPEVRHFVFEAVGVERFVFQPGQFVSFSSEVGGRRVTRAYSICSELNGNRLELCLNRVKEGRFSPYLFVMEVCDLVEMTGPHGFFTLKDPSSDMVMLAAGTGIAPFRSMIRHWIRGPSRSSCLLLFGVRYEETILYREEWETLTAAHPNFHFWPTLSRPHANWRGRRGHVQHHLMEAVGDRRDIDVYVCGLKAMVNDVRAILQQAGFDRKRIAFERYD